MRQPLRIPCAQRLANRLVARFFITMPDPPAAWQPPGAPFEDGSTMNKVTSILAPTADISRIRE
jgi:hypothetical protein